MYELHRDCKYCGTPFIAHNWRAEVCSHQCHLARRRAWHKTNGDRVRASDRARYHNGGKAYYKQYERTPTGFIMRKYRNMQSRVLGIQKVKFHLYSKIQGPKLLDRDEFYKWSFSSKVFKRLYHTWVQSGYQMKLSPSVDRIDPCKGYVLENMEWVTHSENSRRSSITRKQTKI